MPKIRIMMMSSLIVISGFPAQAQVSFEMVKDRQKRLYFANITVSEQSVAFGYSHRDQTTPEPPPATVEAIASGPGRSDALAVYSRGMAYVDRKDYVQAIKLFRLAAKKGYAPAQNALGDRYYNGEGVTPNYAEAFNWYQLAAAQGLKDAQYSLGLMYRNGEGGPRNYDDALEFFRLAEAQGDARAQYMLGVMYENGEGVTRTYAEAVKWYRLAAAQGFAPAQHRLGIIYSEDHDGVSMDYVRAYMWFDLAAGTATERDAVAAKMTPSQIAAAQEMAKACQQRNFKDCD
jgi:TPR repeat protein